MSVKKFRDPAGILPDQVRVEFDGHPDDFRALSESLKAASPNARIERLRRHPELSECADDLAERFRNGGSLSTGLALIELAHAEYRALYLDAAPAALTGHKVRRPHKQSNDRKSAAAVALHAEWQRRADSKRADPRHAHKSRSEIAKLIAQPGENWNTIRRNIK